MVANNTYHILGAGISGLVLAYELAKKGKNVRVYEKSTFVGGLARTEKIDDISFDCGPHLFHTNNNEIRDYWLSLLKDQVLEPDLYGANLINEKLYEYPISYESLNKQFTESEIKIIKKQLQDVDKNKLAESKNYYEYVSNLAGEYLADLFFTKYPKKLWGIPTNELSAKFAPRRVEIRDSSRAFHSGKGKWAGVLKNGCGALAEALKNNLISLGVYIEFNKELIGIENKQLDNNNSAISSLVFNSEIINLDSDDIVISTIPITIICNYFGITHSLWYRNLKILGVLVADKKKLPGNYDWLYLDDENIQFHRVTLQNSFSELGIPEGHSLFSCEIAYSENDDVDKTDNQTIINVCCKQLEQLGLISQKDIVKTHLIDAGNVYPGMNVGYEEEVNKVKAELGAIGNLYLHGAPAEYEYSDLQVLTAKSIDLADVLSSSDASNYDALIKKVKIAPANSFSISNKEISQDSPCYIIAEIGLNHNGDVQLAKKLIDQAKRTGANAVKLQTYKKGRVSAKVRSARYYEDLVDTQESIPDLLDRIAFTKDETKHLFEYAKSKKITIFSTPFDFESLHLLESMGCEAYKISSMDIVNLPLIKETARLGKPIIISTGMSELSDIQSALDTVLGESNNKVALLHCVSSYPCPPSSANLSMISKLKNTFNTIVGYSDHTTGIDISLAAVSLGAKIIEKHFTSDRKLDGPDQNFSIVEAELSSLVASTRRIESALMEHGYGVLPSELNTAQNLRRSMFFSKPLKRGHVLVADDIEIKSPGIGIHPKYLDLVIGRTLEESVESDYPLLWSDLTG
jgi:sialic acid synthase SpsE/protoporphyrinogen oxidase